MNFDECLHEIIKLSVLDVLEQMKYKIIGLIQIMMD